MYPPEVEAKLKILDSALDFPSDREAARHLGVHRTTILKYRRRLRLTSRVELIASLEGRRGPKPRARVGKNPHVMARWINSENPTWGAGKIAGAMREMGHRVTPQGVEGYLKTEPNLDTGRNVLLDNLDQATEVMFLYSFLQHPVRILAILNEWRVSQSHTIVRIVNLIKKREDLEEEPMLDQILATARADIEESRKTRKLIQEVQGRGIRLNEECLKEDFLEALRNYPWQLPKSVTGIDLYASGQATEPLSKASGTEAVQRNV
jgi:hypothetical protein